MIIFRDELLALITALSWIAPTQNTDGTDIDYLMQYQVYVNGLPAMTVDVETTPLAAIAVMQMPGSYVIHVTAMPIGIPELESDPSNSMTIITEEAKRPKEPAGLSAE